MVVWLFVLMLADFVIGGLMHQELAVLLPIFLIYRFIYHYHEFTKPLLLLAGALLFIQDFVRFGRAGLLFFYGALIVLVLRQLRHYLLRARFIAYTIALTLLAVIDRLVIRSLLLGLPCSLSTLARGVCSMLLIGMLVLVGAAVIEAGWKRLRGL